VRNNFICILQNFKDGEFVIFMKKYIRAL